MLHAKNLSIQFQENIPWEKHVEFITHSLSQALGMLNKYRNFLPTLSERQLCFPWYILAFNIACLFKGYKSKQLQHVNHYGKKTFCFVHNLSYHEHVTSFFCRSYSQYLCSVRTRRLSELFIFNKLPISESLFLPTPTIPPKVTSDIVHSWCQKPEQIKVFSYQIGKFNTFWILAKMIIYYCPSHTGNIQ